MLPGEEVAVYVVIVEPPSLAGAVNGTDAVVPETVAVPIVGAPGTEAVVILFDTALAPPVPAPLVAVTVNVYAVFAVKPVTLIGDVALVAVIPSGEEVARKLVIAALPIFVGAVKGTLAVSTETDTVPIIGAPGLVGHMPCLVKLAASSIDQIPLADVAVVVTGFLVINPPGYFLLTYTSPVFVDGN
jgi:hypothetical protein